MNELLAKVLDAHGMRAFGTICRDLDCFTRIDAACRISIGLSEADDTPLVLGPGVPSLRRGSPRPVLPLPEDRPPLPYGGWTRGVGSDGYGGCLDRVR
jgi:hypothetical protein